MIRQVCRGLRPFGGVPAPALGVFALVVLAGAGTAAAAPLRLSATAHDFGVVAPWAVVPFDVRITNDDDRPHAIAVEPACSCTAFALDVTRLAPHESATLHLEWDVAASEMPRATVQIGADDDDRAPQTIALRATIDDVHHLAPGRFELDDVAVDRVSERRIPLTNPDSLVADIEAGTPLRARIESSAVWISLDASRALASEGEGRVLLRSSQPGVAPVPLLVRWHRADALQSEPASVTWFGDEPRAELCIRRRDGAPFRIVRARPDEERLSIEHDDVAVAEHVVRVVWREAREHDRLQSAIVLSAEGGGTLTIPVVGVVP